MNTTSTPPTWTPERAVVAGTAAVVASTVWTHGLAGILRHLGPDSAPPAALPLTLASVAVALAGLLGSSVGSGVLAAFAAGSLGMALLELLHPGSGAAALALVVVGPLVAAGAHALARRLPPGLDGFRRRKPRLALLWLLLALATVVQIGRLATYMTDPASDWFLSTRHPFWAKHECMTAYLYGAELDARGEDNIYDAAHYPGLNPEARPETTVRGMTVEDPYQYPPQFLLLPRAALALTHDFATIRVVWFALQTTLFAAVAAWLALWIGGRSGRLAAFLLPLAFIAFPALHNFQYGQFHLPAVALAVAGMLAFEARRRALGGVLLAVAILAKIFPAVLLVPLLVRRRWRELGWTLAFGAAITALALAVLGPASFAAFFQYQLPRLASGEAFAFADAWPELRELVLAANQGAYGLAQKLGELGWPGMDAGAQAVSKLFGLSVLGLGAVAGLRLRGASRLHRATGWLALVGLASMASTGAWGDYVPVTCTWLLTLLAAGMAERPFRMALLLPAWILEFFILGTAPIGGWAPPEVMLPLSAAGVVAMAGIFGWTLVGQPEPESQAAGERLEGGWSPPEASPPSASVGPAAA